MFFKDLFKKKVNLEEDKTMEGVQFYGEIEGIEFVCRREECFNEFVAFIEYARGLYGIGDILLERFNTLIECIAFINTYLEHHLNTEEELDYFNSVTGIVCNEKIDFYKYYY